ncbi:N-acetylmuramoyl-L-alanine amidase [Hoyosella rhizosphaerae]|uniref:N-acetylmuramoyl-L-alanine amidase n=1 Tax=Hoyosella rhizosphaerae TaxID=1755582 RepID=A0A916XB72_9ACTN|nr:N-acetylmuramoyl-L-alanine amidase [Hoyosella rhizosphaerae]MBN4926599.1 N-acetylmuramoyl-L-alanine amidase [Hoyosella rhizosphaerae]GGC57998.1 hypothetical protein GCM10011410_08090 [Hoyosella rhizosphaerae]
MKQVSRRHVIAGAAAVTAAFPVALLSRSVASASRSPEEARAVGTISETLTDGTTISEVPLTTVQPSVRLTDIRSLGQSTRVFDVTQDSPFSMLGITWTGDGTLDAHVRARGLDGEWGPWFDFEDGHGIESAGEPFGESSRNATEVLYVGECTAIQLQVHGKRVTDISDGGPSDLTAVLVRPSTMPVEPTASRSDGVKDIAGTVAKPRIISRKQWGADESIRRRTLTVNDSLGGVVIHHTAGSNDYTEAQAPAIVRGIYAYHARTLGWGDVGYHALVDKFGNIYEGRFGGMERPIQGAHTGGFNVNTAGFAMLGNFQTITPTSAQREAISQLTGWRLSVANKLNPAGSQPKLTPNGKTVMYSEGTSYTFLPRGAAITLPIVFGHRDVGRTACPGDRAYPYLVQIRNSAQAYMDTATPQPNPEPQPQPQPNPEPQPQPQPPSRRQSRTGSLF